MSRKKGDDFEDMVAKALDLRKTAMSGGYWDNADLYTDQGPLSDFIIECKYKSVPWLRPIKSEILKLQKQALKEGNKEWLYIQRTEVGDFAVMDFNALCELVRMNTEAQEDSQKSYEALEKCVKEKNDAIKAANFLYDLLFDAAGFDKEFTEKNKEKLEEIRILLQEPK